MGAGNGNAGSQLDTGQSSLDVKESDTQEDAQDFVTKALNPYGKSYNNSLVHKPVMWGINILWTTCHIH